jgi:hypothetical protein
VHLHGGANLVVSAALSTHWPVRVPAILLWATAIGFGLPCLPVIRNLLTGRELPMIFGFRAFGGGAFERYGTNTMVALLAVFFFVCCAEGVAGFLLWNSSKLGAIVAVVLVPVGAVFWWGFALPFPPLIAVARTILIVLSWRTFT